MWRTWLCCLRARLIKRSHCTIYAVYVLVLLQTAVVKMLVEQNECTFFFPPLSLPPPHLFFDCRAMLLFLSLYQGQTLVSCICWSCSVCLHHGRNGFAPDRKLVTWPRARAAVCSSHLSSSAGTGLCSQAGTFSVTRAMNSRSLVSCQFAT